VVGLRSEVTLIRRCRPVLSYCVIPGLTTQRQIFSYIGFVGRVELVAGGLANGGLPGGECLKFTGQMRICESRANHASIQRIYIDTDSPPMVQAYAISQRVKRGWYVLIIWVVCESANHHVSPTQVCEPKLIHV